MSKRQKEQTLFMESLMTRDGAPFEMRPCVRLNLDESFRVYQGNYREGLLESLTHTYEAIFKLLGEEAFISLSYLYIDEFPFKSHDIGDYGNEFPQFLKAQGLENAIPFVGELANLECCIKKLFLEKDQSFIQLKVTHPVHELWQSLLFSEVEVSDFQGTLTIIRDHDQIFFKTE